MRIGTLQGRAVLVEDERALDIATASDGRFPCSTRAVVERWDEFVEWASSAPRDGAFGFDAAELEAPIGDPRQVFAIGLNYKDHADEAGLPYPEHLVVLTKFQSSLGAPSTDVELPSDQVDYETELVVVIGRGGRGIAEEDAWLHVAGVSVGQDYSEREVQTRGPAPQFSFGKSYPNFAPFGPVIVSTDELGDPDALPISAVLEGPGDERVVVQDGNTADLIFSVPQIIADLSAVVTLFPGDLIFTGTPAGVGMARGELLKHGQTLTSSIGGVGSFTNRLI